MIETKKQQVPVYGPLSLLHVFCSSFLERGFIMICS